MHRAFLWFLTESWVGMLRLWAYPFGVAPLLAAAPQQMDKLAAGTSQAKPRILAPQDSVKNLKFTLSGYVLAWIKPASWLIRVGR
ncbi:hypothetical protein EMIT053CA3_90139 [Pseudomonas donghuensis]